MPVRRTILVLISVLALIIMAVAVVGALPLVLPVDFAIQQLQQAVKATTGRTLTVSRAPRIVLWPELAIEADDVVLSNRPAFIMASSQPSRGCASRSMPAHCWNVGLR